MIWEISVKKRNGRGNAPKNVADGVLVAQGLPGHVNGCAYAPVAHSTPSELGVLVPFLSLARSQKFQSWQRGWNREEVRDGLGWESSKKCRKNEEKNKILTFRFFVQNWFLWCQSDVLSWLDMSKVSITHIFRLGLKLGCSEEGSDEEEDDPKPRVWKILVFNFFHIFQTLS